MRLPGAIGRVLAAMRRARRDHAADPGRRRRPLTGAEAATLARRLVLAGGVPVDAVEIRVGISKIVDDLPSRGDVDLVKRELSRSGWAVMDTYEV